MVSSIVWAVLLALVGGYELFTYLNGKRGDTLSEKVKPLYRRVPLIGWLMTAFLLWLAVHWWGVPGM